MYTNLAGYLTHRHHALALPQFDLVAPDDPVTTLYLERRALPMSRL